MRLAPPRILEWYRADVWPSIWRALLPGGSALSLGGLVVGYSLVRALPHELRLAATIVGLVLVAGGAIFAMIGMNRLLRDDVSLALRTDGVAVRMAGVETLLPWDDVVSVRWDGLRGELVLERIDQAPLAIARRFAGLTATDLVGRIRQTKRKVAMGLLR